MIQPPVALVNLTQEEKDRIAVISQKSIKRGILIYFIPFVVFGALVAYINVNSIELGIVDKPNLHGSLNVALAILSLLSARLFVNVVIAHQKAINAWQKKVIKGKIQAKDGKIITVVNQKVKLDNEQAEKVKAGDDVIVSVMPGGEFVLDVTIVSPQ
ncbi:MAG: hypothetical protein M3R17_15350 [Bacteroidota bacterium]|nr:hypothetical protein [Bacteroidota bacterium]